MSDPASINDRLEAAAVKAEGASEIMRLVANGAEGYYVPSESGLIPSLLEWQKLNEVALGGVPAIQQFITDLQNTLDPTKGSAKVGHRGLHVSDYLDYGYPVYDLSGLTYGLANKRRVWIPPGVTIYAADLVMPNGVTLIVDGSLVMPNAAGDGAVIVRATGAESVRITGIGLIDGNKANQSGSTTKHGLVHFSSCEDAHFSVARVRGNYFPRALPGAQTTGAVLFENCEQSSIKNSRGDDFARECFWMYHCNRSEMENLRALGGADSWSGMQFSGDYNEASKWFINGAGASGASFDCRYSNLSQVISMNNTYAHGLNFGHDGIPADHSTATDIVTIGGSKGGTSNTCNGVQVGANTVGLILKGVQASGAPDHGIQISDGATDITLDDPKCRGNAGYGIKFFGDTTKAHQINGGISAGNTLGGLRLEGGVFVSAVNHRAAGNTGASFSKDASSDMNFTQVRLSADAMFGGQAINGLAAGGTVTVTNGNVQPNSKVVIQPSNAAGNDAMPFVSTIGTGQFIITVKNASAAGAFIRYWIL